jgi:hypothetical protein
MNGHYGFNWGVPLHTPIIAALDGVVKTPVLLIWTIVLIMGIQELKMAKVQADSNNFIGSGSAAGSFHGKPGKLLGVIASTAAASTETVVIYDNTTASGDVLLTLNVNETAPIFLFFPPGLELEFTALSVDPANCDVFLLTTQ